MTAATSPRATDSETPSSTRRAPWFFTSRRTSIINALLCGFMDGNGCLGQRPSCDFWALPQARVFNLLEQFHAVAFLNCVFHPPRDER